MIRLIPTSPEYAKYWVKWRAEATTLKYNPVVQRTIEDLRERMALLSSDLSDLNAAKEFQFFIQWDDDLVGTVSLNGVNHTMTYGEIGYLVGEDFQGKGIGTEAVRLFVDKVFAETKLRRLVAHVAEENTSSCRLLERVGFKKEGLLREHYLINNYPHNEVVYGLLRSEWTPN